MRKGFMLNEVLIMLSLMIVVMLISTKQFRLLMADIPRAERDLQTNVSTQHMLRRLRQDVEQANALLKYPGDERIAANLILIESGNDIICYEFNDDQVIKSKMTPDLTSPGQTTETWSLSHAKINWKLWQHNGRNHAVEISTSIERKIEGNWKRKLQNSHVFFVGAINKREKI